MKDVGPKVLGGNGVWKYAVVGAEGQTREIKLENIGCKTYCCNKCPIYVVLLVFRL